MITLVWTMALALPGASVWALANTGYAPELLRRRATASACFMTLGCALPLFWDGLRSVQVAWPAAFAHVSLLGMSALRINAFTLVLLPLPPLLWLITLVATPRAHLDAAGMSRTALSTLLGTLCFLTESPLLLCLVWVASTWVFLRALSAPEASQAKRSVRVYLGVSSLLMVAGIVLTQCFQTLTLHGIGVWCMLIAVLVRKGIFPFHAWLPEAFDKGRLGPSLLFSAPQVGAYVAIVLVAPLASEPALAVLVDLSLVTAVYGAALSLVQTDARRACGYLFVSQSALVLAGLDYQHADALAGSLVLWLSSALAITGVARIVLIIESGRGRLELTQHHGGYDQMPTLAVSFLILGLACTGFPGTLGFVGQEMLLQGAIERRPILGFCVVVASGLTGLAVVRMYFSLFCGARSCPVAFDPLRNKNVLFTLVAVLLVASGLVPQPLLASRMTVAQQLRADRTHTINKN